MIYVFALAGFSAAIAGDGPDTTSAAPHSPTARNLGKLTLKTYSFALISTPTASVFRTTIPMIARSFEPRSLRMSPELLTINRSIGEAKVA